MPRRHPRLAPPPASLGLRFRALLGLGFVPPPEPRPCAHCAPSPTRCSRLPASLYVVIEQIQNRRLGRCHREVPRASPLSRPPPAAARVPLSRCVGPGALAGKNRTVCIPFSPNARNRPSSWQHPLEMHAFRDQDGNILALCIHFRAQSGDSGCMARESCRQGPPFASGNPKSRMARRCCQRRAAFPRQRPAVRPNGLCVLRRGPGLLAACAPPAISLVPAAARVHRAVLCASRFAARIAPTHAAIRRAAHCGRGERRSGSSCRPRAAHADASRPSMRARRHRLGPDPRQPSPSPEPTGPQPRASRVPAHPWSRLRPSAPCHPPRLALPRGSRCGSGNSREMVR